MRKTLFIVFVLSYFSFSCKKDVGEVEQRAKVLPLKDFFKDPEKSTYRISPDGEYVLFRAPHMGRLNIFVQKLGDTTALPVTHEKDRSIYDCFWESDNTIVYLKDSGGDENYHVYSVSKDGGNLKDLTPWPKVRSTLLDELIDSDNEILIECNKRKPEVFDVYLINTLTGDMKLVAENPGSITSWITDHNGKVRAALTSDGLKTSLLYRETENDAFKTITTHNFKETLTPVLFTFDNRNLYVLSNIGRDKIALIEYDPANDKEVKVIYENPDVDVEDVAYSHKRSVLTAVYYEVEKPEIHFLDKEAEDLYTKINHQFPGYINRITRKNKAEDKLLIYSESDKYYGGYSFYDVKEDKLQKLADFNPNLNEDNMADVKPITYSARDGLTIHGYLTIPKGVEAKNLPVVINPHGGPWARDSWGFDPQIQFLANRGYAVLQMNFRGSTGYGRKFWESSFKQWGRAMQDDVTDGAKYLIREGIADSTRIAIYGGSYGGYATLAGITLTPDLYACAVDYVGVANMFTFMNSIPPYWEPYREMIYEMVGNPKADSIMLAEVSPAMHTDKIKVPLLVAQGANDPRVNRAESDQMVEALRKRGVTVNYILKDNEGHGFSNEENQLEFYQAMEKFFEDNLKRERVEKKDM